MSTLPKLAELSDSQRRVMCAETLGWYVETQVGYETPSGEFALDSGRPPGVPMTEPLRRIPDPAEDANAALALVEAMRKEGWRCELNNGLDSTCECIFSKEINEAWNDRSLLQQYAPADTLPRAIVSAFLLAKGLAR